LNLATFTQGLIGCGINILGIWKLCMRVKYTTRESLYFLIRTMMMWMSFDHIQ